MTMPARRWRSARGRESETKPGGFSVPGLGGQSVRARLAGGTPGPFPAEALYGLLMT